MTDSDLGVQIVFATHGKELGRNLEESIVEIVVIVLLEVEFAAQRLLFEKKLATFGLVIELFEFCCQCLVVDFFSTLEPRCFVLGFECGTRLATKTDR